MTLSLTIGRDTFKLCHKEGARTTVWDVSKADSEESLIQTFKDVIAFVEGEQAALPPGVPEYGVLRHGKTLSPHGTEAVPSTIANGWAAYAEPKVPEHLAGEIEVIKPGEEA